MKRLNVLVMLATALPLALATSSARADARGDALALVEHELAKVSSLIAPRKKAFSRWRPSAAAFGPEIDMTASVDANGREFYALRFYQDTVTIVGCVYAATSEVFITKKNVVYPIALLQGKRVRRATSSTCVDATPPSAHLSQVFAVKPPRAPHRDTP